MKRVLFILLIAGLAGCSSTPSRRLASDRGDRIWRDRPAFSAEALKLIPQYRKTGFYQSDLKQLQPFCPLAQAYANAMLERLAAANGLTEFLHSAEGPRLLVFCTSKIGDSLTKIDGTIYIGGADILSSRTDDEVAFVLAHELGHVTLGHLELEISRLRGFDLPEGSPDPISQEWEADMAGIEIMRKAGFDYSASFDSLRARRKAKDTFFLGIDLSSGSPFAEREDLINQKVKSLGKPTVKRTASEDLKAVWKELKASK